MERAGFWVPARRHDAEIMDRLDNSRADLDAALADLARINRFLGGRKALVSTVSKFLKPGHERLEILDIGTGGADLPIVLVQHARRIGREIGVTAVDRDRHTAAIAGRETADIKEIQVVRADAFDLPFGPGSFDLVTASLFLHHFRHAAVVSLLSRLRRIARVGVIVNDLRRHRIPWAFIALVSRATRRHKMIIHDGPLSVLRGFTPRELLRAAQEAGSQRPVLERRWPYRLVMTLDAETAP